MDSGFDSSKSMLDNDCKNCSKIREIESTDREYIYSENS